MANTPHRRVVMAVAALALSATISGCMPGPMTTNIRATGVRGLDSYLVTSFEKDGISVKAGSIYNPGATMAYFGSDFTQKGIVPVSVLIQNNSELTYTFLFSESMLSADNISGSRALTVRKIVEQIYENIYGDCAMNTVFSTALGGISGLATSSMMNMAAIAMATVRNDKTEFILISNKFDPRMTIAPGKSLQGILFFDAKTQSGNNICAVSSLSNPKLTLSARKDTGETTTIQLNIQ
jgi:hypothetical protein